MLGSVLYTVYYIVFSHHIISHYITPWQPNFFDSGVHYFHEALINFLTSLETSEPDFRDRT